MKYYILALVQSLAIVLVTTPLIRAFALKAGFIDKPSERRVHDHDIPLLGGISVAIGFVVTTLCWLPHDGVVRAILAGGVAILALGVLDDYKKSRGELSAKVKFLGQIVISTLVAIFGVRIQFVTNPFGGMFYLGALSVPITVLWLVSMTNVVNFMDGLDGLATGISAIAAISLFVVASGKGQETSSVLAAALAGATLGFLRYNFNPAKIFLGDAGAMFIGFTLAGVSVIGALKGPATLSLTIPFLVLGVPIFDTAFAIIRRWQQRVPVYVADKGHIHHRLLDMGLSQRQAVLTLYSLTGLLGLSAVLSAKLGIESSYITIVIVAIVLSIFFREFGGYKSRRNQGSSRSQTLS
ncbi:MAG: undecaprenyl/decaprenyl-phosphate alpha-N-acetylglucosaminyl 1-phosphate transferase [Firmicutes bacterium]|nr:undecaprenyl/decaprenyl-phosphate alpha-N-acetylglucosaminyl 1-phosphate transferase [Bacillota bacterium]